MDWFMGKITGKPHDLHGNIYGFRLRFSQENPIHWIQRVTSSYGPGRPSLAFSTSSCGPVSSQRRSLWSWRTSKLQSESVCSRCSRCNSSANDLHRKNSDFQDPVGGIKIMLPHFVGTKPLLFRWLSLWSSLAKVQAPISPNHLQARISIFLYLSILGSMFQSNDRFADGKRILMVLFAWKKVADPHVFHVLASDDTTCA